MQKLQNGTDLFLSLKLSSKNGVEVTGFIPHTAHANFLLAGMQVFIRITMPHNPYVSCDQFLFLEISFVRSPVK